MLLLGELWSCGLHGSSSLGLGLTGDPEIRPGYTFPEVATQIYFDIEDGPMQDVTYLYGLWKRPRGGEGVFEYILAERPADEKAACQRFPLMPGRARTNVLVCQVHAGHGEHFLFARAGSVRVINRGLASSTDIGCLFRSLLGS